MVASGGKVNTCPICGAECPCGGDVCSHAGMATGAGTAGGSRTHPRLRRITAKNGGVGATGQVPGNAPLARGKGRRRSGRKTEPDGSFGFSEGGIRASRLVAASDSPKPGKTAATDSNFVVDIDVEAELTPIGDVSALSLPGPAALDALTTKSDLGVMATAGARGLPVVDTLGDGSNHAGEPRLAPARPILPEIGQVLGGRYRLDRQIGVGGFGAVYQGEDLRLRKQVAVKVLSPQIATNPEAIARFQREAIAAGQVGHDGIVDVTDIDRDERSGYFIVMEYLHGADLAHVLRENGPLAPARALSIAIQVADALGAAHRKDILHRDLKPANIYLTCTDTSQDVVKIIDFGISKVRAEDGPNLTRVGQVIGTLHYMAPEQAMPKRGVDARMDVYALGVILYEILVGHPPFAHCQNFADILVEQLDSKPTPPSEVNAELPRAIDPVVLGALTCLKSERYASMADFAEAMLGVLETIDAEAAAMLRPNRKRGEAVLPLAAPEPPAEVPMPGDRPVSPPAAEAASAQWREGPDCTTPRVLADTRSEQSPGRRLARVLIAVALAVFAVVAVVLLLAA